MSIVQYLPMDTLLIREPKYKIRFRIPNIQYRLLGIGTFYSAYLKNSWKTYLIILIGIKRA